MEPKKTTRHGGVPEEQPAKGPDDQQLQDETTGDEGGGPALGYGANPHGEKPDVNPDATRTQSNKK